MTFHSETVARVPPAPERIVAKTAENVAIGDEEEALLVILVLMD
tara:strand:- start:4256 stop:4387 length:132 start_codon:yes stop_codon:yes gene_type:complete